VNSFIFAHFDRNDTTCKCHLLSSSIKALIKSVLHILCAKFTPSIFVLFFISSLFIQLIIKSFNVAIRNLAFWWLNCSIWDFRVLLLREQFAMCVRQCYFKAVIVREHVSGERDRKTW
jgi:hypothetical protein